MRLKFALLPSLLMGALVLTSVSSVFADPESSDTGDECSEVYTGDGWKICRTHTVDSTQYTKIKSVTELGNAVKTTYFHENRDLKGDGVTDSNLTYTEEHRPRYTMNVVTKIKNDKIISALLTETLGSWSGSSTTTAYSYTFHNRNMNGRAFSADGRSTFYRKERTKEIYTMHGPNACRVICMGGYLRVWDPYSPASETREAQYEEITPRWRHPGSTLVVQPSAARSESGMTEWVSHVGEVHGCGHPPEAAACGILG